MPAWLRRLISRNYRNALAAEAAGEYVLAAEQYALAGLPGKVAEMHLVRAKRADPVERADILDDALRWFQRSGEDDEIDEGFPEELAKALLAEAKALSKGDPRQGVLATEAAELYEAIDLSKEAGEAFELIGNREEAARCYEAAGHIEGMERLLDEDSRSRASSRAVDDAFDEYEIAMACGARDRALSALRRCCAEAPGQGYERMLSELERRLPPAGVVEVRIDGVRYAIIGSTPTFIGRGDAHLKLRHAGISRRHAAIDLDGGGFHLRDAGSRNGTLIGGLPLAGRVPLAGSGVIGLGDQCTLQFAVDEGAVEVEVLDGPDRGRKAIIVGKGSWRSPEGRFRLGFRGGRATVESGESGALIFNGVQTAEPVVVLIGDTLEAPGQVRLEVIG